MPEIDFTPSLGQRLRIVRAYRNLSQSQLALILNVTQSTIARWEANQVIPDWGDCKRLCDLMRIKESFLAEMYDKSEDAVSAKRTQGQKQRHSKPLASQSLAHPLAESLP